MTAAVINLDARWRCSRALHLTAHPDRVANSGAVKVNIDILRHFPTISHIPVFVCICHSSCICHCLCDFSCIYHWLSWSFLFIFIMISIIISGILRNSPTFYINVVNIKQHWQNYHFEFCLLLFVQISKKLRPSSCTFISMLKFLQHLPPNLTPLDNPGRK